MNKMLIKKNPEFITDENRVQFITRIHIHKDFRNKQVEITVSDQVSDQVDILLKILKFCKNEKTLNEIMELLELKHKTYFRKNYLNQILEKELLELTDPNNPTSPKQKYKITKKGLERLEK